MEEQIKQAVEIAISGTSDYNLRQQAIQYLNELKESSDGWQAFLLLLKSIDNHEQVRFIALQAITDSIPNLSPDQNSYIRTALFQYLQSISSASQFDPPFLKNKLAEAFAALFCASYLNTWSSFFKDFAKLIQDENETAVDQYLRILLAIHSEIGDQLIIRERPQIDRNNNLKDTIRANDMVDLTLIWKSILSNFKDRSTPLSQDIQKSALKIIGGWVSWIEISLIVGSDYINLILSFLSKDSQKSTACETLVEIVSKKMKPENKLQLLSLLNLTGVVSGLPLDGGDVGFVEDIAKLYNAIGLELSYILDSSDATPEVKVTANEHIINLFPFILNFLSNPYDDVAVQVLSFLSNFLTSLKKIQKQNNGSVTSNHLELLNTLLSKVILKIKYDEDDDGDDEDSNDEFNDFRSRLKVLQDSIAVISPDIYVEQVVNTVNQSVFENNGQDWRQLELGLYQLTNLSESLRSNLLNIPKYQLQESKPYTIFQGLLLKTINSNVVQIDHPLIQILFFELIVHHYNFLNNAANKYDLTNHILSLFTSSGLFHSNKRVQLRCWYLFFRFVKLTKPQLSDDIIERLVSDLSRSLLVIETPLPQSDEDSEISEQSSKFDSQLYLFETLGLLISLVNNSKVDEKLKLLNILLTPIFNELQVLVSTTDKNPQVVLKAHHLLMAIGTIARGFEHDSSPNKSYPSEVLERFNNTAEVVLVTLDSFSDQENVRDAARFSFARFIPILKANIHSHLSRLISILLASSNLKVSELTDFLGFIGQIVHSFNKDDLIYQLLNDLFTPLSTKVSQLLNDKGENSVYELMPDVQREKSSLKKQFITLLIGLHSNNVSSLLITQTNKAHLPIILQSLLTDANNLVDLPVSKIALSELGLFTSVFGNDTVNDPKDKYGVGLTIEGISSFLLENLVKLTFEIPFQNTSFDIKDAQYRFVADELANILKTLYRVKKEELLTYLKDVYFPQIQLPSNVGDDLINNLINLEIKDFKKYFVNFVLQLK